MTLKGCKHLTIWAVCVFLPYSNIQCISCSKHPEFKLYVCASGRNLESTCCILISRVVLLHWLWSSWLVYELSFRNANYRVDIEAFHYIWLQWPDFMPGNSHNSSSNNNYDTLNGISRESHNGHRHDRAFKIKVDTVYLVKIDFHHSPRD